jgi:hypothetical protein
MPATHRWRPDQIFWQRTKQIARQRTKQIKRQRTKQIAEQMFDQVAGDRRVRIPNCPMVMDKRRSRSPVDDLADC